MLRVVNVSKRYPVIPKQPRIDVVSKINIKVEKGRSISIVGPSGCGKSTLLLMIAGLEPVSSGDILFHDKPMNGPHRNIGLVLQDYGLFPWKTVRKNIELGLTIRKSRNRSSEIQQMLTELGISEKSDLYPQQLSGGQKQRVALARALILNPELLLLDEPFAALDTLTRERLQDLTFDICKKRSLGMILVTHNIQEAVRLGHKIIIMSDKPGRLVSIIENKAIDLPDIRKADMYFDICRQVRRELENVNEKN